MAHLDELPAELYTAILEQFEGTTGERQHAVAALIRAIPRSPVPYNLLFERIHLARRQQSFQLYRVLWKRRHDADRVRAFSYECWDAEADHVVNLVGLLRNVEEMTLWSGPSFTPENLEDLFTKPKASMRVLSIRFRPYVQRATYYQFLKGAYFDSTLEMLSRWPRANLLSLSIVQDPLEPDIAPTNTFAQPLVFFRLDPICDFARSPHLSTVLNFRFRIPTRTIARQLSAHEHVLPSAEFLDLSTTRMSDPELEALVGRLARLKYLILDGCPLIHQREDASETDNLRQWSSLGSLLAAASIRRSKEKENQYRRWARKHVHLVAAELPSVSETSSLDPPSLTEHLPERILVIPPVPTLLSFAMTAPMVSPGSPDFEATVVKLRQEFEHGWGLGLHKIAASRQRMRNSWARLSAAVYKMMPSEQVAARAKEDIDILQELKRIQDTDDFEFAPPPCPMLCLVGPGKDKNHPAGCPHRAGWECWSDDL